MTTNPVYIILSVDYRADYGQSLKWIAPEIADEPELTLTEDHESEYEDCGGTWHRKWAGIISPAAWDRLVSAWSLDTEDSEPNMGMLTEYGHLASYAWNMDGMDWNMGGETPILFADLSASIPADHDPIARV